MMKKLVMLLTVLAAFVVIGCGSDNKPASVPTQSPQAAPAVQKDSKTQEDKQTAAKSKPKKKDYFANCTGEPLHQFKY